MGPPGPVLDQATLMAAPPQQQKQMLGEALYPKIYETQPDLAGKITGMLLEMDNLELVSLLSNQEALNAKVAEAVSVYDDYVKKKENDDGKAEDKPE